MDYVQKASIMRSENYLDLKSATRFVQSKTRWQIVAVIGWTLFLISAMWHTV